jgi:hypothetical protein
MEVTTEVATLLAAVNGEMPRQALQAALKRPPDSPDTDYRLSYG